MSDTLSELSHALFEAKEAKRQLNEQIKTWNERIRDLEHRIWQIMEVDDLHKFTTSDGTVYRSPQVVPKVVDWGAFYRYIEENQAFHMLERRPTRAAFRELHQAHKSVPGVEAVEFDEVRTRKS